MTTFLVFLVFFGMLFSETGREMLGLLFKGFMVWVCLVAAFLGVLWVYVFAPMVDSLQAMF